MKKRVLNFFKNIKQKPDVILIKNSSEQFIDENFFYSTGLNKGLFENSFALLYPEGSIDIITTNLEYESAKKASANIRVYKNEKQLYSILKELLKKASKIGINAKNITYKDVLKFKEFIPNKKILDVSQAFIDARMIKDETEIDKIKKAAEIADKTIQFIPEILHKGMTEYELAAEISYSLQKNGADKSAFDIISSFGENTAEPHYTHGDKKLKNGDIVLCDFGACFQRYNSDITRTFIFGKASEKQKRMYNTVLKAQKIGFEKIKTGVKANIVHNAVKRYIDSTEFKNLFIHSTGHALGMSVHDPGIGFNSECKDMLQKNMVLTVEPGVYISGYGGVRIEDDILVKKDGLELLTKSSRGLIEI